MDLLAKSNNCGQTILKLVARGNSILAELMRLSDHVPAVFCFDTKGDQKKYEDVFPDFIFFKYPQVFEDKIEKSLILRKYDQDMREIHGDIVVRIYSVFEGIHHYITDLIIFLQELSEGIYFQRTIENIFSDEDGQQLMCEALYLYGTMLLIAESYYTGLIRERIIVAYHRHFGHKLSGQSSLEDVCKLLRSTGYNKNQSSKKLVDYPENYFARVVIPEEYINLVIGYLRADDIYHQTRSYPSPDHRSTALSTQASMLFVCLYFSPNTLHSQTFRMREIVDKFFADNWVLSYYMGNAINLIDKWDSYKAAKTALSNTIATDCVKEHSIKMSQQAIKYLKQTEKLLAEGKLTEVKVLDRSSKILNMMRHCNVLLRWIILHTAPLQATGGDTNKKCVNTRIQIIQQLQLDSDIILKLLVNTSIVELALTETYKILLDEKESKWDLYKKSAYREIIDLSEAFGESRPLSKVHKNERLTSWFKEIAEQVIGFDLNDTSLVGRKIIQIVQALKEVQDFHEIDASAGVIQSIGDSIKNLQALVKVASINDDDLITLASISDLSYAWLIIDSYTNTMQDSIKSDPLEVARLRATFLKLSSGLELPLLRINQANSPDIVSVSAYYSGRLVEYIRKILQIIPQMMFHYLDKIIQLQTSMEEISIKLYRDDIKIFAQLDKRYKLAELTQKVAVLSEGVTMMESTLVGVVEIDPKKLLQDGIRRQLVLQVATILNNEFIFNPKAKDGDLIEKLDRVFHSMKGYKVSFEYIQDYINIHGLKLWQEEIARIVNFNVQQECNQLLKKQRNESYFEDDTIPIPNFAPTDSQSINFIGRLSREILRVTNPKTTIYIHQLNTWFDPKSHKKVLDDTIMVKIENCLCAAGLVGIDRHLSFLIVKQLQELDTELRERFSKDESIKDLYEAFENFLATNHSLISQPQKQYENWLLKIQKVNHSMLDKILKLGQMQILRTLANDRLNTSCKYHHSIYESAVNNLSKCLLFDMKKCSNDSTVDPDGKLIAALIPLLEWCGLSDPTRKIYFTPKPFKLISLVLFGCIAAVTNKLYFDKNVGSLVSRRLSDGLDSTPLVIGLATVLRQYHSDHTKHFMTILAQYSKSYCLAGNPNTIIKGPNLPLESFTSLVLFKDIADRLGVPMEVQKSYFPLYLFTAHTT